MIDGFYAAGIEVGHLRFGPLASQIDGFAGLLLSQGYATHTGRWKIRVVADLSRWLHRRRMGMKDLNEEQIGQFLKIRKRQGILRRGDLRTLGQLVGHLCQIGVTSSLGCAVNNNPIDRIITDYGRFLSHQRGLSEATLDNYLPIARRFLKTRFGAGKINLPRLCGGDVTNFIVGDCSTGSPRRVQLAASALRSFLGFLTQEGKISAPLAASVPSVANWRLGELPQFLEPTQVEKLLNHCNQNSRVGRRDYAVLLLLARLGLRAGEVVHLSLEDINWEAGEVLVRGKSAREDRLPLLPDVGQALVSYLKADRPCCRCRRVFIRMRAPHQGFSSSVAICSILRRALVRADLDPEQKGAHLLRRSLATQMLGRGASLSQIGQVLRHQLAQTTEIYAKVDLAALRDLAQPWPGGAR
jgi:site-specific recombinase XerD